MKTQKRNNSQEKLKQTKSKPKTLIFTMPSQCAVLTALCD